MNWQGAHAEPLPPCILPVFAGPLHARVGQKVGIVTVTCKLGSISEASCDVEPYQLDPKQWWSHWQCQKEMACQFRSLLAPSHITTHGPGACAFAGATWAGIALRVCFSACTGRIPHSNHQSEWPVTHCVFVGVPSNTHPNQKHGGSLISPLPCRKGLPDGLQFHAVTRRPAAQ